MSFWVYLHNDEGSLCTVDEHTEGGAYLVGGASASALNITYNYSPHYYKHLNGDEGLRWLHGKQASEVVEQLAKAVDALGVQKHSDYWEASEGNAGYALSILLRWAKQHPGGVFTVS